MLIFLGFTEKSKRGLGKKEGAGIFDLVDTPMHAMAIYLTADTRLK